MLATEYAKHYNIKAQQEEESNMTFRNRVAAALREMGRIIEAHEAYQDERYKTSDSVMPGVTGTIAQALQGRSYSGDQIGNDIFAGTIVQTPDSVSAETALLLMMLR